MTGFDLFGADNPTLPIPTMDPVPHTTLTLMRSPSTEHATIGKLFIDGAFECFTLEDVVRQKKIYAETAIPPGIYVVILTESARFKRVLPLVKDVPNFTSIRVHAGNTDQDTSGCILVGQRVIGDKILDSTKALEQLMPKLEAASKRGRILLDIHNAAE
jgi:hypothetical protein